jgi:hypothetical protein
MLWTALIVIAIIVAICLDSKWGKVVLGSGVVAIGMLFLSWITDFDFFISLAKLCAAAIVIVIVAVIVLAIIGSSKE